MCPGESKKAEVSQPFESDMGPVTRLIREFKAGNQLAEEELLQLVYRELHGLARYHMAKEAAGHTLRPSDLVHEAYLRMREPAQNAEDRRGFLVIASEAMRRVLVDHARRKKRVKRGEGKVVQLENDELHLTVSQDLDELLDLLRAIEELNERDPRKAQIVIMRFIGGLSREEAAAALGLSEKTITREWRFSKAWLRANIRPNDVRFDP